ncbi:hypothetical protein CONPUDRAFT_154788 [Coniophora puteana RWD-64-598 SS2]|uniref:Uncharacterized protein n=1 Tax=Coniophora puteana (strain RWD-64-598) TaxID=741705 RepID=A0A5M3MQL2_CONPW|nr:uncharacterized protein CONPUDRAFT_154788 [Coniophora puteana RWD-64-598 SS2]EIW80791.1 hypothetical protein CONPUDRAFT_154788 [Coniophora puteana RWD-64-598 SS2]
MGDVLTSVSVYTEESQPSGADAADLNTAQPQVAEATTSSSEHPTLNARVDDSESTSGSTLVEEPRSQNAASEATSSAPPRQSAFNPLDYMISSQSNPPPPPKTVDPMWILCRPSAGLRNYPNNK